MSKLIKTDADYSWWIQALKDRCRFAQIKTATRVNQELLRFYWSVGRDIVARDAENKYGSGFYKNLSQDLKDALPESDGFSSVNLFYMRRFYDMYSVAPPNLPHIAENSKDEICPQLVGDFIFLVPWGHHRIIIDKYYKNRDLDAAIFYLKKTVEDGWSRNILKTFIDSGLHLRQGKAQSSFSRLLPAPDSDLAQELTRDPYIFDFTEMTEPYKERELKKALMDNISRFLLELGSGFAYVGQEYRLKIGHTEKFIDLLFYNIRLHAYCVIEVKTGTFDSGDIGQLGTYMTAVNHLVKTEQDNPTIGLLICKDKDNVLAQYVLEPSSQPIGVAEFQLTKFIPDEFKSTLPTIEDIESGLK
ncbi:MAG: PDDEXK nuclease domain-containing protein [Pseudoflavonifractor sp.]|nr:PDDEXK nuclease domain-containing protein [Pseudoflavonifractor sp.]